MAVENISDKTFSHFLEYDKDFVKYFNKYLMLPIFNHKFQWNPIEMAFQHISYTESSLPQVFEEERFEGVKSKTISSYDILEFVKFRRLKHFLHSQYYRTYKLFKLLSNSMFLGNTPDNASDSEYTHPTCEKRSVSFHFPGGEPIASLKQTQLKRAKTCSTLPAITQDNDIIRANTYPSFGEFQNSLNNEVCGVDSGRCSVLEFTRANSSSLLDDGLDHIWTDSPNFLTDINGMFIEDANEMSRFLDFINSFSLSKNLSTLWYGVEELKECYYEMSKEDMMSLGLSSKEKKIKIFRFIQERFRFHLTNVAMSEIMNGVANDEVAFRLLHQAQHDVLERLKNYWLPRFIYQKKSPSREEKFTSRDCPSSQLKMFPSISVVKSLPIHGVQVTHEVRTRTFSDVIKFQNERWLSGRQKPSRKQCNIDGVMKAMQLERKMGNPFMTWLKRKEIQGSTLLMFWLDVDDYITDLNLTEDRFLRLSLLWKLFHKHLYQGNDIISAQECNVIHSHITSMKEITKDLVIKLFSPLQNAVLTILELLWNTYYNQDTVYAHVVAQKETFSLLQRDELFEKESYISAAKSAPASLSQRWVKRHPGSTESERQYRLHTALSIAERGDSKRFQRPTQGILVGHSRKQQQISDMQLDNDDFTDDDDDEDIDEVREDFSVGITDPEILSLFKQFIENAKGKNLINELQLYLEIEAYFSIGLGKQDQKQQTAIAIYETFFNPHSRRSCKLPGVLVNVVRTNRPNSPTLREAQHYVIANMEQCYKAFIENFDFERNNQQKHSNDVQKKRKSKPRRKMKENGSNKNVDSPEEKTERKRMTILRSKVKKEDRHLFQSMITSSSKHRGLEELFRKYLLRCENGGFARLEKDLLFCFEINKFKELFLYLDDYSLNKKAEVIVDVFLDSATPPWLQIDVSPDVASKVSQSVEHMFSMHKKIPREQKDCHIFDKALAIVTKELLPFWSRFLETKKSNDLDLSKLTKNERRHIRLFEEIETVHVKPCSPSLGGAEKSWLMFSLKKGGSWKEKPVQKQRIHRQNKITQEAII